MGWHTCLLSAASLFFFMTVLMLVATEKARILKNTGQLFSGRNACANARANGEAIHVIFRINGRLARTAARIWSSVRAP
jgi:hypothetical protein